MAAGKNIQTWFEGQWHDGNLPIIRSADHATWLGTLVFDGARAWQGKVPDLDAHCQRINDSAVSMGMKPTMAAKDIVDLTHQGLARMENGAPVYIRPMYWSTENSFSVIVADPESTAFCLCLEEVPMPAAEQTVRLTLSSYTRPTLSTATVDCKAACLYPNNARMMREAKERGFDNALVLDVDGNVAESATANVFMVRDGIVLTPAPNGTFLNGITKKRIMDLLQSDGIEVREDTLAYEDFMQADEIFLTGNISKVTPVSALDDKNLQPGPVAGRARDLYWQWAGFSK